MNHSKSNFFTPETDILYFTGTIDEVTDDGIFYYGYKGKLNFINFDHLISISEEEVVSEKEIQEENENQNDVIAVLDSELDNSPESVQDAEELMKKFS